jgi:hypothetical protein
MREFMGISGKKEDWRKYYALADKRHNIGDQKLAEYYEKGEYENPMNLLTNLMRNEVFVQEPFKLFHRGVKAYDKTLQLGTKFESKF